MRTICTVLLLRFLLFGTICAQQIPRWARSLPDLPNLPGFYQGLGSTLSTGDVAVDWQEASGQARSQILQQIRVVVINKVTAKIVETSSVQEASITEAFASTTDQLTMGTLEGIVAERWFDEEQNKLYAYASIPKAEVDLKFEEQLQSAVASARIFYDAAAKALANGDAYLAIGNFLQGIKVVSLAEYYLNKVISGDVRARGENVPVLPVLQSEMCAVLNNLQLQITGGNDQLADRGRALLVPLSGRVVFRPGTESRPARNVSLSASFVTPASGSLSAISRTDEQGEFQLSVTEVNGGEAVNTIRVSLSMPGLEALTEKLPDAIRCLSETYLDFTFKLKTRSSVTIAMHILEYNLAKKRSKSTVQEEVQRKLLSDRYSIVEESKVLKLVPESMVNAAVRSGDFQAVVSGLSTVADVVVVGVVSTEQRTNPTAGIYFSSGTAVIRAIDAKSGQILASVSLDNEKEGGGSYEVAGMRLLQRMGKKIGEELKSNIDSVLK